MNLPSVIHLRAGATLLLQNGNAGWMDGGMRSTAMFK
jgi:hypothetical protein